MSWLAAGWPEQGSDLDNPAAASHKRTHWILTSTPCPAADLQKSMAWLRAQMKTKTGVLNQKRVDYFKGNEHNRPTASASNANG